MASGILNVNKPAGPTSFAVVRAVGRLPGVAKTGHGGTLDPSADGVLPILVNGATRLADFIHEWPKTYQASVTFGAVSSTGDREGTITPAENAKTVTREAIVGILPSFTGTVQQVPPIFSALKQGGEALYRKARRHESIERSPRPVEIHAITLLHYDPASMTARLEVQSGRGMYVRSLAQDMGAALGSGAYLSALTRLAVGPLTLDRSIPLKTLIDMRDRWEQELLPMDLPLEDWPAITLKADEVAAVRHGQALVAPTASIGRYRMLDADGRLVAWGEALGGRLQPRAVFRE